MRLIPAIDLRGGVCVRLEQGDFGRNTQYSADPIDIARKFQAHGAMWLHMVDLDGARDGVARHLDTLSQVASATDLDIEYGGGLRSLDDVERALTAGAKRVVLGTAALEDPTFLEKACSVFGERIVVGLDARDGLVATRAWLQTSHTRAIDLVTTVTRMGAMRIIYTDIKTDGMLTGPNLTELAAIVKAAEVPVIASGGVASIPHLTALAEVGAEAAIVGKALYTGDVSLTALRDWQ
jgi:phosphoribosylformimino-5-aminoimidazole carboxamide ribotide isomerase